MRRQIHAFLFALILTFAWAGCQKSGNEAPQSDSVQTPRESSAMSMLDVFFTGSIDDASRITQTNPASASKRSLFPIKEPSDSRIFRYVIVENDPSGFQTARSYLIADRKLNSAFDLFTLDLRKPVSYFSASQLQSAPGTEGSLQFRSKDSKHLIDGDTPSNNLLPGCTGQNYIVCIDWYWTVYDSYTGEVLYEMFLFSECYDPCQGGGGGGGNPTLPPEEKRICEDNFSFVPVTTNSLWQEALVTNVYCNLVNFVNGTSAFVQIDQLYFGLPKNRQDGTTWFTENEAKWYATVAFNKGEQDMRQYFKTTPTPTALQLQNKWIERADFWLKEMTAGQGKVTKTGSQNPSNTVPPRQYVPKFACSE